MFRAGSTKYVVKIMPGPLYDDGEACDGLCDPRHRLIKVCPTLPLHRRFHVVCHEIMHAWLFTVGNRPPADLEACCDLFACAAEQLVTDLVAAGGVEALLRLRPGEELGLETAKIGLSRNRICGLCNGTIEVERTVARRVWPTPDLIEVRAWCDFCNLTFVARERMTASGQPSGEVVGETKIQPGNTLHLPDLSREVTAQLA